MVHIVGIDYPLMYHRRSSIVSDMSDYTVKISHEDVEELVRSELKEVIKSHKLEMLNIERDGGILDEHEDYINSKRLIHAAAVVLHYYSVPADWAAVQKIQEEHEV